MGVAEDYGHSYLGVRLMMLALFEIGFQDSVSLISNISFIFGHFSLIQPSKTILNCEFESLSSWIFVFCTRFALKCQIKIDY